VAAVRGTIHRPRSNRLTDETVVPDITSCVAWTGARVGGAHVYKGGHLGSLNATPSGGSRLVRADNHMTAAALWRDLTLNVWPPPAVAVRRRWRRHKGADVLRDVQVLGVDTAGRPTRSSRSACSAGSVMSSAAGCRRAGHGGGRRSASRSRRLVRHLVERRPGRAPPARAGYRHQLVEHGPVLLGPLPARPGRPQCLNLSLGGDRGATVPIMVACAGAARRRARPPRRRRSPASAR
jgi:hypothetical protein